MKITLSLNDDVELRSYIKDMIRGQVKSVARDEMKSIIAEAITPKITSKEDINNMVKEEVKKQVINVLSTGSWSDDYIKAYTRKLINERLKEYFDGCGDKI
jgi:hypothetical protein